MLNFIKSWIYLPFLTLLSLPFQSHLKLFTGHYPMVIDGDSIEFYLNDSMDFESKVRGRLMFIDAPEIDQKSKVLDIPVGRESYKKLRDLLGAKKSFYFRYYGEDRYGRWLLEIGFLNSLNARKTFDSINLEMIRSGFAKLYSWSTFPDHKTKRLYKKAYLRARELRLGLWKTPYINPYLYRKKLRRLKKI